MDEQTELDQACRADAPRPRARSVRATYPWCTSSHFRSLTASTRTIRPSNTGSILYGASEDDGGRHFRPALTSEPTARTKPGLSQRSEVRAGAFTLGSVAPATGLQSRASAGHRRSLALAARAAPAAAGSTDRLVPATHTGRPARPVRARPREPGPPRAARADGYGLQRVRAHAPCDVAFVLGHAADGHLPACTAAYWIPALFSSAADWLPAFFGPAADWLPAFFGPAADWLPAFFSLAADWLPTVSRTTTYGLRWRVTVWRRRRATCPASSLVIPERLI